jgi:hypothetical protein
LSDTVANESYKDKNSDFQLGLREERLLVIKVGDTGKSHDSQEPKWCHSDPSWKSRCGRQAAVFTGYTCPLN